MRPDIKETFIGPSAAQDHHVAGLEQELWPAEEVLAVSAAVHTLGPGLIAVTDQRILFISSVPGRETQLALPITAISMAYPADGPDGRGGELEVTALNVRVAATMHPENAKLIAAAAHRATAAIPTAQRFPPPGH